MRSAPSNSPASEPNVRLAIGFWVFAHPPDLDFSVGGGQRLTHRHRYQDYDGIRASQ